MNSQAVKASVLCWLRFHRQFPVVATECGYHLADVAAVNLRELVEVEVKVDRYDLRNDAKKPKHENYQLNADRVDWAGRWIPNRFFFAVPESLRDEAVACVEKLNPSYGVLVVASDSIRDGVTCFRRAKPLHKRNPLIGDILDVAKRMSSELCSWHIFEHEAVQAHRRAVNDMSELIRAVAIEETIANEEPLEI